MPEAIARIEGAAPPHLSREWTLAWFQMGAQGIAEPSEALFMDPHGIRHRLVTDPLGVGDFTRRLLGRYHALSRTH